MKHSFFDKYSYLETPIHKIPAVIKIVLFLFFAISVIIISKLSFLVYLLGFFVLAIIIYLSKIPVDFVIKKSVVVLPFIFLITLCNLFSKSIDYAIIIETFLNSFLIICALILLVETTKFSELLKGLSKLGIPKIIIILLSFIYRYFFVLIDEAEKMMYYLKIRSYKRINLKTLSNMIGTLFIRSYERAERIYSAMRMRGFNGKII
ncbi:MAG: energy-coupling factor transporter transmembrane component T family protein [Endomicrobiia bacterium]